jgi:pentatricopeptide repeat protein
VALADYSIARDMVNGKKMGKSKTFLLRVEMWEATYDLLEWVSQMYRQARCNDQNQTLCNARPKNINRLRVMITASGIRPPCLQGLLVRRSYHRQGQRAASLEIASERNHKLALENLFHVRLLSPTHLLHHNPHHHVKVDSHTFLQFATHFAKNGHFEQALDAILEAKSANAALDSFAFRSNCATLLRNSIRQPAGLRVCLRIVDNLVKIGVTLNNQLCNIVMLNAVEAGDLKTAFSIYSSLVEHGLEADSYTYAILLKGCKSAIDDAETLNDTIRSAIQHVNLMREPVVSTEILHCLALHHKKHHPERAFDTVADAFAQLFDPAPLQKLGLLTSTTPQASHLAPEKMQPSCSAMAIMIAMYLDHAYARSQSTFGANELYKRFRTLADSGAEPFASMIETDHISNCFLTTFIKSKKGLLCAAEVIKDMQRPSHVLDSKSRCRPTQQSWSIFLHGFTSHGLMKLAEQVLNYMRGKNIQPNKVTWNTLAVGYASAQDVEGTLDVLRRMEEDSVTWDEWTLSGLRKLQDQESLRRELERRREVPQLDFTHDIKDGLGERLNAFGEAPRRMEERRPEIVEGVADSPSDLAEAGAQIYTPFN